MTVPADRRRTPKTPGHQPDVAPPLNIPGYDAPQLLGAGGMSYVYLARQTETDRLVALKVLRIAGFMDDDGAARFAEEARIVAKLRHRDIVQLYEVGETADGLPFLVLEYVPGPTLAEFTAGQPQDPRAAARLVELVARAVHYAHEQGVIHRDLKPGNVLLKSMEGTDDAAANLSGSHPNNLAAFLPKITDFGLAKALADSRVQTQAGMAVGTPGYMAPEQATGDRARIGPCTDVYALGIILYELLTGRLPFPERDPIAVLTATRSTPPPPPRGLRSDIPRALESICLKCLAKRPEARYESAADLADDLRRYLDDRTPESQMAGSLVRPVRSALRYAVPAAAVLAVLALVGYGTKSLIGRFGSQTSATNPTGDRPAEDPKALTQDLLLLRAKISVGIGSTEMGDDVLESARRRVEAFEKAAGPLAIKTIEARRDVALVLSALGRWSEVDSTYARGWADARDALGPDNALTAQIAAGLRDSRARQGAAAVVGSPVFLPGAVFMKLPTQ